MKKSKFAPWLKTISGFVIATSILVGIGYSFAYSESESVIALVIAYVFAGVFSGLLMLVVAEILEYLQHITKQLDDLYNQNEPSRQHFDKTI